MTDRSLPRALVHAPGTTLADDAQVYDFDSPELVTDVQRSTLEAAFETWAKAVATQMMAKTRRVMRIVPEPFVLTTFAAFGARFGREHGFIVVDMEGSDTHVVYAAPMVGRVASALRMMGGRGDAALRGPTRIERALVLHLADEHMHELKLALGDLLPRISIDGLARSLGASVGDPDELMICVRFDFDQESAKMPVDLAIPAAPVLQAFGHGLRHQDPVHVRHALERHVADAPVQVALRFQETRVNPSIVLGLGEGSLIPLTHPVHRPLALTVDGDPILRVTPGANGDRLACVVLEAEGALT